MMTLASLSDVASLSDAALCLCQSDGQMNYQVILQAVMEVSNQDCTPRVCGVILNLLNCLLDIGIIEKHRHPDTKKSEGRGNQEEQKQTEGKTNGKDEKKAEEKSKKTQKRTCHSIAMKTVMR